MPNMIRAALVQTDWTGDKESMIDKHEESAREAAAQGAQVMCFQELFYGPYFCQVQDAAYYDYTEEIPAGPTTQRFRVVAERARHGAWCCRCTRRCARASTTTPRRSSTPMAPTSASTASSTSRT